MLIVKSAAKVQQKLHICKFLSGIFEKSRSSLLLLGIDSRPYACIKGGYIALKERAQPFSKIPLILAYGLQDATVPSEGTHPAGEGACRITNKNCVWSARRDCIFEGVPIYGGGGRSTTKIAYVPHNATFGRSNRACAKQYINRACAKQ